MEKSALFKLLKRLSKGEVRYIREELLLNGKESQVLQLFDLLRKNKKVSKRTIHQKLKVSYPQIPKLKYRLKKRVIGALAEKNKLEVIDSAPELIFANILWGKGLIEEAKNVVAKAKEKARNKERFGNWIQIIEFERQIGMVGDLKAVEEEKEVIGLYENWLSFKSLRKRLTGAFGDLVTTPPKISLLEQVRNDPLLQDTSQAKSKKALFEYQKILADLDYMYGRKKKGIEGSQTLLSFLEDNANLFPGDYSKRIEEYGKIAIASYSTNQWELFVDTIGSIYSFPCSSKREVAIKFDKLCGTLLSLAIDLGDLKIGKWVNEAIEIYYPQFEPYIDSERFRLIQYGQANSYFVQEEFEAAYRWCGIITNTERSRQSLDTFLFSRLLGLISLYEMKQFKALEYHLSSLESYINSLPLRFELPKLMVSTFKKLQTQKIPKSRPSKIFGGWLIN